MHQCDSCHVKSTKEQPIEMYRFRDKVYCTRCITLEGICILTTDTIFGVQPDRYLAPLMKDAIFTIPDQRVVSFTTHLEGIKRQLIFAAKDQAMKERGNVILGAHMTMTKLDNQSFLVSMTGTIVYSRYWDEMFVASNSFVAVANNEETEESVYRVKGHQEHQEKQQRPSTDTNSSSSTDVSHEDQPRNESPTPEHLNVSFVAPEVLANEDYMTSVPGTEPTPMTTPTQASFPPAHESVVGKYPDVGGSTQMSRFRKLTENNFAKQG